METKIRNATLSDLPTVLHFARSTERHISADEVQTWLEVDPLAILVAETSTDGKLVGVCCGISLSPDLGFIGLYLVLEEYRGKGTGYKLWKKAREHLDGRNIGVHAIPEIFRKYKEKEGFCHVEDYTIQYYEYFGDSVPTCISWPLDIEVATYFEGHLIDCHKRLRKNILSKEEQEAHKTLRNVENGKEVLNTTSVEMNIKKKAEQPSYLFTANRYGDVKTTQDEYVSEDFPSSAAVGDTFIQSRNDGFPIHEVKKELNTEQRKNHNEVQEFPSKSKNKYAMENSKAEYILSAVVAFDKSLHCRDRSLIVRQTFSWSSCRSKVALMGGKVVGYACLRKVATEKWIISPFYADMEEVAEILLSELLNEFDFLKAPKGILIRFPDRNIACKRLVEKFGFREKPIRILTGFTKRCINVDTSKVYSFHSIIFSCE